MINYNRLGYEIKWDLANFSEKICRITIHMLQLNIKKAEIPLLCYILITTKKTYKKEFSAMATITQDMRYRLSLIKYAERFGVTKAAVKYKTEPVKKFL